MPGRSQPLPHCTEAVIHVETRYAGNRRTGDACTEVNDRRERGWTLVENVSFIKNRMKSSYPITTGSLFDEWMAIRDYLVEGTSSMATVRFLMGRWRERFSGKEGYIAAIHGCRSPVAQRRLSRASVDTCTEQFHVPSDDNTAYTIREMVVQDLMIDGMLHGYSWKEWRSRFESENPHIARPTDWQRDLIRLVTAVK